MIKLITMRKNIYLFITCSIFYISLVGQITQFPQIFYNGQGLGGANINIRSAPSQGASIETTLLGLWQIGAVSEEISLEPQGYASWAKVCLPTVNNQIKYGYILYGEYYGRISAVNTYATVNASNLNIREGPGIGFPVVKIGGQNATYSQNSIVALTGNENGVWYEVYLPNNCNIASKRGWLSSENNLLTKNINIFNYYNIAGRVTNQNNVSIWGADVYLGNFGIANSTEGFYQYKLPIGWSGNITCDHPNYNSSIPQSYFHIANSHTYTNRDFVLSNAPQTCVQWTSNPPSNQKLLEAVEYLCNKGIIESNQDFSTFGQKTTSFIAQLTYNSLFYNSNFSAYSDKFPSPLVDLDENNPDEYTAINAMIYLEYGDGIPCLERYSYNIGSSFSIETGRAIRAFMEAWKISPDWNGYDKNSFAFSAFLCNVRLNNPYFGYIQKAFNLGLLNDIIKVGCLPNCNNCLSGTIDAVEAYIILYNIMNLSNGNPPIITINDYFLPNSFKPNNYNNEPTIDRGVFTHYTKEAFTIPSGGIGLDFSHSFHSDLSELPQIPFLNPVPTFNQLMLDRLSPLGSNWSHSYNSYILLVPNSINHNSDSYRYIINWPNGSVQSFDVLNNKYETQGVYDKLIVTEYSSSNLAKKINITSPDGTIYYFEIDNLQLGFVLNLVEVQDKNNNKVKLEYEEGGKLPTDNPNLFLSALRLSKVIDITANRFLKFNYYPNSYLIQNVTDNIGRIINFKFDNNQDLIEYIDAKNQRTQYLYGTTEKDKHLLKEILLPKGNKITNTYSNRKLKSSSNNQYSVKVDWNQDYVTSGNTNSTVSSTLNGQTYETQYNHDKRGNIINITAPTGDNITVQYNDPNNPDLPTYVKDNSKKSYLYISV
ncbi:MAG: SH3 domain-containing protein [Saprospiraceae bacterium]|nr:SH3 domain-containing protein [Saprospiraceae bacterium]